MITQFNPQRKHNMKILPLFCFIMALAFPITQSITISYVPYGILKELYRPPINSNPEVTDEYLHIID